MQARNQSRGKVILVTGINVAIALLHFATGSQYRGPFPEFVNGYLIDILLPFGFYFLLSLNETRVPLLKSWIAKSLPVFGAASLVELSQCFGVAIFGETCDPMDFVMYGTGVLLASILDTKVFPKIFTFWRPESPT